MGAERTELHRDGPLVAGNPGKNSGDYRQLLQSIYAQVELRRLRRAAHLSALPWTINPAARPFRFSAEEVLAE